MQQTVNIGNAISNYNGIGEATISSTNFTSGRALTLNGNSQPTIYMVENADASKNLQIDTQNLYVNGSAYSWASIVNPAQGPEGSIQLSNGSGIFSGSTGFYYSVANNRLYGGINGNYITFDDNAGNMVISPELSTGNLYLHGGASGLLNLEAGSLSVAINSNVGSAGQYLGSNGSGGVVWSPPSIVASGTIDQTGFTESDGLYYKDVNLSGMYPNGLILATANGTPIVSSTAWIVTVQPDTDKFTIWTAANPVSGAETWEAHYAVTSFGTPAPLTLNSTDDGPDLPGYAIPAGYNTLTYKLVGAGGDGGIATVLECGAGGGGGGQYLTDLISIIGGTDTITLVKGTGGVGDGTSSTFQLNAELPIEALGGLIGGNGLEIYGGNGGNSGDGTLGGPTDSPGFSGGDGGGGGGGGNSTVTGSGGAGGNGGGSGTGGYGDGNGGAAGSGIGSVGDQGAGWGGGGGGGSNGVPPTNGSPGYWEVTISYVAPP